MNAMTSFRRRCPACLSLFLLSSGLMAAMGQAATLPTAAPATLPTAAPAALPAAAPVSLPAAAPVSSDYKIGIDDVLTVSVWQEPDLSRNITVRPDGKISLPLVGELQVVGETPVQLVAELKTDLARFIKDPELTVIVAEIRSRRINIVGQVAHPGTYAITQQMGVLDAIAEAGGLREFANKNKIYVLRETSAGERVRLKYDYRAVLSGKHDAQDLLLQLNDTVVVP